jgi:hypothetical protein
MKTMAKAVVLLLVVAFVAGVWESRYGQDRGAAGAPAPFRTTPLERSPSGQPAPELVSVRATERDGYDRVVFSFRGSMPGYRVRYVDRVTGQGGDPVPLRGGAFLEVSFEPARARDPSGEPTFATGELPAGSPALRQVGFAGDFEGRVRFGIGVVDRDGFRVSEHRGPTRVAVDVR